MDKQKKPYAKPEIHIVPKDSDMYHKIIASMESDVKDKSSRKTERSLHTLPFESANC